MFVLIFVHWTGTMNRGYVYSILGVYSSLEKAKAAAQELPFNASEEWVDYSTYWETERGFNDNSYQIHQFELDKIDEALEQRL